MVHVKDHGSHFDAPIDKVWEYVSTEDHGKAHKGSRNREMKQIDARTMELSQEMDMGGHWVKIRDRITVFPPAGMAIEMIEGPMAGSKFFNYYAAKGDKTEVGVLGEFVSTQIPPAQLEATVNQVLEHLFEEDKAGIREFTAKK